MLKYFFVESLLDLSASPTVWEMVYAPLGLCFILDELTGPQAIGLCILLICGRQFGLILVRQELRLRLVFTRFSLWRLLQNHTLTTSFSRWRPLAMRAISCEEGLLFSMKLRSRASFAPRLRWRTREGRDKIRTQREQTLNYLHPVLAAFNTW